MSKLNIPDLAKQRIFEDPQYETFECAAGSRQLEKFLQTGTLKKGFAVLSNLSLYCKGKCYIRRGKGPRQKQIVDYRVDISDISRVTSVKTKKIWLFILALLFGLLAPVLVLLNHFTGFGEGTVFNPLLDAGICALLAVLFALEYSLQKTKLLQFAYSGGTIALDTKDFSAKEEELLVKRFGVLQRGIQETADRSV